MTDHDPAGRLYASPENESNDPEVVGSWEMISARFQGSPTHAALLHTNQVFAYGGSSLDRTRLSDPPPAEILDLDSMEVSTLSMEGVNADLWCGGHTFLEDGRLLFAGGTGYYPRLDGIYGGTRRSYIFDPQDHSWTDAGDMRVARWYPTLIRLADNTVLTIAGLADRFPEFWVRQQEAYFPGRGWELLAPKKMFPLYPRLHLLPDGNVFYSGVFNTHFFIPRSFPSAIWERDTGLWRESGGPHFNSKREEGVSLLLALRPPDYRPEVLVAGGGHHNRNRTLLEILKAIGARRWLSNLGLHQATDSVERIDLGQENPTWRQDSVMLVPRIHAVGVLLPDGNVLAVGGMSAHSHFIEKEDFEDQNLADKIGVLWPEMYDVASRTWHWMAPQQRPRLYHSTALLLPDGRVISMGGNPYVNVIEKTIEIFSPPYLFRGPRPQILAAPGEIGYGENFSLAVDDAGNIEQVVLMRPEVLTHVTNTDQRLVELVFEQVDGGELSVRAPATRSLMPQGYVMVFVLNGQKVPSVGKFVKLN